MNSGNKARHYRWVHDWVGRIELPEYGQRRADGAVLFYVEHAPSAFQHLIDKYIWLIWRSARDRDFVDVRLDGAAHRAIERGCVIPTSIDGWDRVSPMESLASHFMADGDSRVALDRLENIVQNGSETVCYLTSSPTRISGTHVALVQFIGPESTAHKAKFFSRSVRHYHSEQKIFSGDAEQVLYPMTHFVIGKSYPRSCLKELHNSPYNSLGFYAFGVFNEDGEFEVQALEPRKLKILNSDSVVDGSKSIEKFLKTDMLRTVKKHSIESVKLIGDLEAGAGPKHTEWLEGDTALVIHLLGGLRLLKDSALPLEELDLSFGHLSLGTATVVRDPFTDELVFELDYSQVYYNTNTRVTSCRQRRHLYMGRIGLGCGYSYPVWDLLVRIQLDEAGTPNGESFLSILESELDGIQSFYRAGGGTGRIRYAHHTNCTTDTLNGLYAALNRFAKSNPSMLAQKLLKIFRKTNSFFGKTPPIWERNIAGLTWQGRPQGWLPDMIHYSCTRRMFVPAYAAFYILKLFSVGRSGGILYQSSQFGATALDMVPLPAQSFIMYLKYRGLQPVSGSYLSISFAKTFTEAFRNAFRSWLMMGLARPRN